MLPRNEMIRIIISTIRKCTTAEIELIYQFVTGIIMR